MYGALPSFIIVFPYNVLRHYSKNDDTNNVPYEVRVKNYVDLKYHMLDNNEYRIATNKKIMSHQGNQYFYYKF